MHDELCPFCGTRREMDMTSYRTISIAEDGKEEVTMTTVYHCCHCGFFVRSEDIREEAVEAA